MSTYLPNENGSRSVSLWPWVYLIALIYLALHMATSTRYGYFRDALYYFACSEHLAFGYVDQPPLIALLAWLVRHTTGTSLPSLIFWPALAGSGRIVLTAAFARELGAKKFGTALAAVLAAVPAVWWVVNHQFAMNALEPLFWGGCAYVILRLVKTQNPRLWLAFGVIAGVGLENKYSIGIFAFALLVGVLLTQERRILFTPWILAGGFIAFLIFLPNLIWNIQHHWPFLELMHNISATGKDVILPPGRYLLQQVMTMNPITFPFWFGGLIFYFLSRDMRPYRVFGWAFIITIVFFMITHGKDYYSVPAYVMMLAGGAAAAERLLTGSRFAVHPKLRVILKTACLILPPMLVIPVLPLVLPVLSVDAFLRYQSHLPFEVPKGETSFAGAAVPQYYADEFPWPDMVARVAEVYKSLTPEEQTKTAIFCDNYGQAAAVDFFGPKYGLPKAISGHQSYFIWGPRNYTGEIVIRVGASEAEALKKYESVEVAASLNNPYALWYENQPILLCRGLKLNLQTDWSRVKNWR